jgi:uncharacterized protein (DUF608 family)
MRVQLTGWSPFIPTDEHNSSLPIAAIEYKFVNTGNESLDAVFSFNTKNFLRVENGKNAVKQLDRGFILSEEGPKTSRILKLILRYLR